MRVWSVIICVAMGCAEPAGDPCAAAADHIASCTGEAASAAMTCDEQRAEEILTLDCDQLASTAAAAKADGWWDSFMCTLGFTSYCSSGSGTPAPTTKTLSGSVYKVTAIDQPAMNVYVRAIREGTSETKGGWVIQGLFAIQSLPVAKYRLEVALTPTSGTLATKSVDLATTSYVVIYAPVP